MGTLFASAGQTSSSKSFHSGSKLEESNFEFGDPAI